MQSIEVIGGSKYQKEITEKIVNLCIKELMPRIRKLDIAVYLKDNLDGAVGYCTEMDHREFQIEVDRTQSLKEFVTTITHEMVHVKQYAYLELGSGRWKKCKVSENTEYMDLPWEKEAFRLQDKLAQKVWEADIL